MKVNITLLTMMTLAPRTRREESEPLGCCEGLVPCDGVVMSEVRDSRPAQAAAKPEATTVPADGNLVAAGAECCKKGNYRAECKG